MSDSVVEENKCNRCKREKVDGKCPACGRPTKYLGDEEMIPKVDEYLKLCVDTYDPETKQRTVRLPMLEDFALELGINDTTLVEWRKKYPEFSTACSKIEIEQKKKLANEALAGNYNPVIAKLHLAANHGMADKVDQDITSDGKPLEGLAVQFVDAKKDDSGSTTTN